MPALMITRRMLVWAGVIFLLIADIAAAIENKGFFFYGMGFLVLFILISIFLLIRKASRRGARKKELADWARSRGLSFIPDEDYGIGSRYWPFDCLQWGDNCYAYNTMDGAFANRAVCAFDYHFEIGVSLPKNQGEDENINTTNEHLISTHHNFSAVIVDTGLRLKPLFIRPEDFIDRIAHSSGYHDIEFESTEFNKHFYIKASDRRWAYDVLNQSNMDLLLSYPRFIIEFQDSKVIAYRKRTFSAAYFEEALQLITGILDRLPESVVQQRQLSK